MASNPALVQDPVKPPRSVRNKGHAAYGKSEGLLRAAAVEIAADMEMGYYQTLAGEQWPARPFVIEEVIERSGYSRSRARKGTRPSWWPGNDVMRRMVSLKILLRQAQRTPTDGEAPWVDAALAAGAEELLRRLYIAPMDINSRDLVDLTTKLARMREERRAKGEGLAKNAPAGSRVFQRITETILELPEEEQARARVMYERALENARQALPALVSKELTP